ncbi:transcriptional repressor [Arthrobacter sp. 31Cvi3.1E]|nr:transcriptional repressor [Arthrobacter sp. 31Cvi3.1E]
MEALRVFCQEVLPLDDDRLSEARVVMVFWQQALGDPERAAMHEQSIFRWIDQIQEYLAQARATREIHAELSNAVLAGIIMNVLLGAQISAALSTSPTFSSDLSDQIEGLLQLTDQSTQNQALSKP